MVRDSLQPGPEAGLADARLDTGGLAELRKMIRERPKETFNYLRRVDPIRIVNSFAVVTRYDDVREVLGQDDVFHVPYEENFGKLLEGRNFFLGMQNSTEYRQDVDNMRKVVRKDDLARIATFVERAARQGVGASGRLEVVEFAARVAMALVHDYFGTPPASAEVAKQTGVMLNYLFLQARDLESEAITAAKALRQSLQQSLDARKKDRGKDDVLERCLQLQDQGVAGMTDERIIDNLFSLVVAAVPTTAAFVARATDELLRLPRDKMAVARQAALKDDLDAMKRYAFEAVRLNALGPGVFRTAAEAYTVAQGTPRATRIPKGARVLVALQSAMLDEEQFDSPQEFRTDRDLSDYIFFGHGLHTCFGQHINQVQLPRIVQALLRLENLRRAKGKDGKLQLEGTSPKSLWVEFDPEPAAVR